MSLMYEFVTAMRITTIVSALLTCLGSAYFGWFTPLGKYTWQTFAKNFFVQLITLAMAYRTWLSYERHNPIAPVTVMLAGIMVFGIAAFTVPAALDIRRRIKLKRSARRVQAQSVRIEEVHRVF